MKLVIHDLTTEDWERIAADFGEFNRLDGSFAGIAAPYRSGKDRPSLYSCLILYASAYLLVERVVGVRHDYAKALGRTARCTVCKERAQTFFAIDKLTVNQLLDGAANGFPRNREPAHQLMLAWKPPCL